MFVDRLSTCRGRDFRRTVRSDFNELSGIFRPSHGVRSGLSKID